MKLNNVARAAFAVLIATQLLNSEVAHAKFLKNVSQKIHTRNTKALHDPYFKIKSVKVKEITDEEALEYVNSAPEISTKGFVGPDIPNVPPVPPTGIVGGINPNPTPLPTPGAPLPTPPSPTPTGAFDNIIMVVDKLIAIGQKIIPTIKEGKAIVTNNPMSAISVLPRTDARDPQVHDMGGWTVPVSKHYKISYTNGFGSEVVSFVYSITYQYNGSADGKGKYLSGVRASATAINISWGFDLDASSQLLSISNVGTQQNVIAGATIEMDYTVKNWTRTVSTFERFFVSGDGKLYKMD